MFYRKCSKRRKMKVILCGTVMYILTMWLIGGSELRIFNTGKKQVLPSKPGLLPAPKYGTGESVVKIQTYSLSIQTCSLSILSLSGQRILRNMEICCDDLTPRDYFTGSWTKTQFWMAAMFDDRNNENTYFFPRGENLYFSCYPTWPPCKPSRDVGRTQEPRKRSVPLRVMYPGLRQCEQARAMYALLSLVWQVAFLLLFSGESFWALLYHRWKTKG